MPGEQGLAVDASHLDGMSFHQLADLLHAVEARMIQVADATVVGGDTSQHRESTVDIALAAYYLYSGLKLVSVEARGDGRHGANQDCRFHFVCPKDVAARLRAAYANSEAARFDASMRSLRKFISEARYGRAR